MKSGDVYYWRQYGWDLINGVCLGKAGQVTIALGSEPTTLDPQIREDGGSGP